MDRVAKFFIDNYKFTFVLTLGVFIFGLMGLMSLKSESYPAVNFASATITTNLDGASAEEVETSITKKIEDEIRTVSGLKDVRSTSQPGVSSIFVRIDIDNVDVDEVMIDLQRAIDRVSDLPAELKDKPKFVELKSEEFPVYEIAVIGDNTDRARDQVADLLKEAVEDNKSVLSVRPSGFLKREFNIHLDGDKMQQYHVGIDQIMAKIRARNTSIPGGKLEKVGEQKLVRIEGEIENKQDIEEIVIRSNYSGKTVQVKDIATVVDGEEIPKVLAKYNGRDATLLIVTKKGGADTIAMVEDIEVQLKQFSQTYKDQFEFVVYNNEANRVREKLGILSSNALTGLLLVLFFLMLFLPGRIGLVASLSLPLGILATLGFLPPMDMNLNAITILALVIALGMLVDNSVVISENYARLRSEGYDKSKAASLSIQTLWLPISATVFTTIAAFLPMLVTTGIMGEFIKYIPIIVSIALLMSLVESFFLLPMRLTKFDSKHAKIGQSGWFDKVAVKFEAFVRGAVRFRYLTLLGFTGTLVLSVVMMVVFNKMVLFPAEQTEMYVARVEMEKGTRLEDTNAAIAAVTTKVDDLKTNYFKHVTSRAGLSETAPMDPKKNRGDHVGIAFFYANDDTKNNISHLTVLEKLRGIPSPEGVKKIQWEAVVNGPPVGEPVNATFRSNNMDSLDDVVGKIVAKLESTTGIRDVNVDRIVGDDEVYVDIDYTKADRLGLDVNTIGNAVRAAMSGKVVSSVNLDNKEVDLLIRMQESDRLVPADISQIRVADRSGNLIPLSSLATLRVEEGGPQIKRFDFKRSKTVTANIDAKVITAIDANLLVENSFNEMRQDHTDVSLVFGGEGESTKESMSSLFNALIISLIGIFALLVFLFNSFVMPFVIMTTIPLGLVGFSIAFAIHGKSISFLALIGVIGLGGIIVNSGIILISFIEDLKKEGGLSMIEFLGKASRLRLRAVVVSSLTTISGLLPTAYGIGGMDAILMPMTLAMAWGLTSGTILTLVWVPCAYAITEDVNHLAAKIFRKNKSEPVNEPVNVPAKDPLKEVSNS
jgi:multidrug efflux pump subunit AcrB